MTNDRWQMTDGKWQIANGRWQMANGRSQRATANCQLTQQRHLGDRPGGDSRQGWWNGGLGKAHQHVVGVSAIGADAGLDDPLGLLGLGAQAIARNGRCHGVGTASREEWGTAAPQRDCAPNMKK